MGLCFLYTLIKVTSYMRKGDLTADEVLAIEKARDERTQKRNKAFGAMRERDRGYRILSNGVRMRWSAPDQKTYLGEDMFIGEGKHRRPIRYLTVPNGIPDGYFALDIKGNTYLFDTEEFRRWLRWA